MIPILTANLPLVTSPSLTDANYLMCDGGAPADRLISVVVEVAPLAEDDRTFRRLSRHLRDLDEELEARTYCLERGVFFDERLATQPLPAPGAPLISPQTLPVDEQRRLEEMCRALVAYAVDVPPAAPKKADACVDWREERKTRKARRKAQKAARRHYPI